MKEGVLLLGACGMGMAPLAIYLKEQGRAVWVADDAPNPAVVPQLERLGILWVKSGIFPEGIGQVVYSPAVSEGHPLRIAAAARGIPQVCRGLFLAECLKNKRLVAIVGSHGKTTTTALLIHALRAHSQVPFSYLLGGLFRDDAQAPAHYDPAAEWVVAEIDESDGSIKAFAPEIILALNLDWDHPGYYTSEALLDKTFRQVFEQTKGAVFIAEGNKRLEALIGKLSIPVYTFGLEGEGIYTASVSTIASGQQLSLKGSFNDAQVPLPLQGAFNALNALSALAVCQVMTGSVSSDPFQGYAGVARRQDKLFDGPTLKVFADYAHHPVELDAFLKAFRKEGWRSVVIFQPHRYTRTAQYAADFARVLDDVDALFLLPVYEASETPFEAGQTEAIAAHLSCQRVPIFKKDDSQLLEAIATACQGPSQVFFIGAGDIDQVATAFVKRQKMMAANPFQCIFSALSPESIFRENEPLGVKTTLRVGGASRYYAEPANEADLLALITCAKELALPYFILGRGSNLLVPDAGYAGLVIRLSQPLWQKIERVSPDTVWVGAGARLKELCGQAATWGVKGFEFLEGIPGSVGGALRMNAGAMGGWMFDVVEAVEILTTDGQIKRLPKGAFTVGYRACEELKHAVALGALLKGSLLKDIESVKAQMMAFASKRKASQPREPSAGCMFKNPEGDHAGRLVDISGLKGLTVGGARVSPVHGNFVVNQGGATAQDVFDLVRTVHQKVRAVQGVSLEPEVMILGGSWSDVL